MNHFSKTNTADRSVVSRQDMRRVWGEHAYLENRITVDALVEIFKTCFGPAGSYKIVIDAGGIVWIANDAFTILDKIDVQHPAARMLTQAAKAVHKQVGDGSVSTILLIGSFLHECEPYVKGRKGRAVILAEGLAKTAQEALNFGKTCAVRTSMEDCQILGNVARTALSHVTSEARDRLSHLVVEAVQRVKENINGKPCVNLDNVDIRKRAGDSPLESVLLSGFAFFRETEFPFVPKRIEGARILVLKGELAVKPKAMKLTKHTVTVQDVTEFRVFQEQENLVRASVVTKIKEVGANVVVVEKGIDPHFLHMLARNRMLAVRRVVIEDLEKIAKCTGATIATEIDEISEADLGHASLVEERKLGHQPWTFFEGVSDPRCVTLLLRGTIEQGLNELERAVVKALRAVKNAVEGDGVVAGGGAFEMTVASHIRKWALTLPTLEQVAALNFAKSLNSLVVTLIKNSAMDPNDYLPDIISRYASGEKNIGIDSYSRMVVEAFKYGIVDPLSVKEQVLITFSETAASMLRIDDIIVARKLEGEAFDRKFRDNATKPERVKKIHRDYGIDNP